MNWLQETEIELQRSLPDENPGRTRTIARRAAGIALKHFYASQSDNFLVLLQQAAADDLLPNEIREIAERMIARVDAQFNSPSTSPLNDAKMIIEFIKQKSTSV